MSHNSRTAALALLTEGRERSIDIMRVDMVRPDGSRFTETSVVGLGIGYNADLMAGTDEELKKRTGWFAYVVSGIRAIRTHAVRARVAGDVEDPSKSLAGRGAPVRKTRSILVVTCGLLVGGLRLLEDSEPDDGIMETVVAEPKSRFELILQLGRLIARRDARGPNVDVIRSRKNMVVECPRGTVAQIDGDPVGDVTRIEVTLRPGVLTVLSPLTAALTGARPAPTPARPSDHQAAGPARVRRRRRGARAGRRPRPPGPPARRTAAGGTARARPPRRSAARPPAAGRGRRPSPPSSCSSARRARPTATARPAAPATASPAAPGAARR